MNWTKIIFPADGTESISNQRTKFLDASTRVLIAMGPCSRESQN